MARLRIGAAIAARVEETYEPNFNAVKFFPDWDPAVVQEHGGWLSPDHYDPAPPASSSSASTAGCSAWAASAS